MADTVLNAKVNFWCINTYILRVNGLWYILKKNSLCVILMCYGDSGTVLTASTAEQSPCWGHDGVGWQTLPRHPGAERDNWETDTFNDKQSQIAERKTGDGRGPGDHSREAG